MTETSLPQLDRRKPEPLWHQVEQAIRERIESGEWPTGSRIPAEDRLCDMLGVSRITVRHAIRNLEESGGKPRRYLSVDIPAERVLSVFDRCRTLLYQDGRHQTWVRGAMREQLILEYDGMLFLYPDDLSFRDVLHGLGVREDAKAQAIGDRDYVKVNFQATADPEEARLMAELRLQEYGEG